MGGADGADLHEAIFTKGDVQGLDRSYRKIINHPCNVDFRHHICPGGKTYHTAGHGGEGLTNRMIVHIMSLETPARVLEYVAAVVEMVPVLEPSLIRVRRINLEVP